MLNDTSTNEAAPSLDSLKRRYNEIKARNLVLDMTRGKPSPDQLDLSNEMLSLPGLEFRTDGGVDSRNYGGLDGIPEARDLFAGILDVSPSEVIIGGNSSLMLMYDALARALLFGVPGGARPWKDERRIRFLCPSPGFDRHFAVTEHLGFELVTVGMKEDGPDMDEVESLAAADEAVKGIWCVPKYSNPTGAVYSDSVVERLAAMRTAAPDFRIMWDNAYAEHSLDGEPAAIKDVLGACREAGNPERVLLFASTSKISHAGSGVSAVAGSEVNIEDIRKHLSKQTIGPDKVNQLRHVRFFRDLAGLRAHMRRHAAILKPKFDIVEQVLQRELAGTGVARWTHPRGGYFVSLDTVDGCAREAVRLAGEAGVKYTQAGATFPYGRDPGDRNIRIAPTFLPLEEIEPAIEVLAVSVQLAASAKR